MSKSKIALLFIAGACEFQFAIMLPFIAKAKNQFEGLWILTLMAILILCGVIDFIEGVKLTVDRKIFKNGKLPGYRCPPPLPKRKTLAHSPIYDNTQFPPPRGYQAEKKKNEVLSLYYNVESAKLAAINQIKAENIKKTKYIYICIGGRVIILNSLIGDVKPILIVKPE